jgi:hypothetical protein
MPAQNRRHYNPLCATIDYHLKHCPRHRSELKGAPHKVKFDPKRLPNPWLFDSEKLLTELDRCRELVCHIPVNGDGHAVHFATQIAIDSLWHLREQIRFLLGLHIEGQRSFAQKADTVAVSVAATDVADTTDDVAAVAVDNDLKKRRRLRRPARS